MTITLRPAVDADEDAFRDPGRYVRLPSVAGLLLSPDGSRLVAGLITPTSDGTGYRQSLWDLDPAGLRPARRVTFGGAGEAAVAFLPNGDLLFLSARPDADSAVDAGVTLWLLPAHGGEALRVAGRPGGIAHAAAAQHSDVVVFASPTMPSAITEAEDRRLRAERRSRGVTAVLHDSGPLRYWDRDLGPDEIRLFAMRIGPDIPPVVRDLTPNPGKALRGANFTMSPDGSTVATTWQVPEPGGGTRWTVVLIDTTSGEMRPLLDDPDADYLYAIYSPDGRHLATMRDFHTAPHRPPSRRLVVAETCPGGRVTVLDGLDRWPAAPPVWSPDGRSLFLTADDHGRTPVFRIDLGDDTEPDRARRVTLDDAAYTDLQIGPDATVLYALRSSVDAPPYPVRLDAGLPGYNKTLLAPVQPVLPPGSTTEVVATAADGTSLRGWLALPEAAGEDRPAPLVVFLHGGPYASWTGWSWRWNPWLMTARGYAVLMPDPGMSSGYGDVFASRGWGAWGDKPYTDVLAITEATEARPDICTGRTAVMGGSFGGYLANWIAGQTDRFAAIVSHAGMWALDQFGPTSDLPSYWARELDPDRHLSNSPHHRVGEIRTPMLIIHAGRDFRVPLGESLRMWTELRAAASTTTTQHRFLYFPNESHEVGAPQHVTVWFETVLAFLDATVLGLPWTPPGILG